MKRRTSRESQAASCYFRSSTKKNYKKALIQITEKCNLHCKHCFLSSSYRGEKMTKKEIEKAVIPKLEMLNVISVTLTGGEIFTHPNLISIVKDFRKAGMSVTLCSNATLISEKQIEKIAELEEVSFNISLDGFRPETYNKFRGREGAFRAAVQGINKISNEKLLKGILVTPNKYPELEEYASICKFGIAKGAEYVLMNPLSRMGRGVKSADQLRLSTKEMINLRRLTSQYEGEIELVYIRFPNTKEKPLSSCEAGNILYVFQDGKITPCPYLIFAARSSANEHHPEEFITGNIFDNFPLEQISNFNLLDKYNLGNKDICTDCSHQEECGYGCPAAIMASGKELQGEIDHHMCPNSQGG